MLRDYIEVAIERAEYKRLEDGSWFAEIPGFQGVWADGTNVEVCRRELIEVLEEWIVLKIRDKEPVPVIKGADVNIRTTAPA
jgi:predicted RNase H-like HicB family nuclease